MVPGGFECNATLELRGECRAHVRIFDFVQASTDALVVGEASRMLFGFEGEESEAVMWNQQLPENF